MPKPDMLTDAEFLSELESLLDCVVKARVMIRQMQQGLHDDGTTPELLAEEHDNRLRH